MIESNKMFAPSQQLPKGWASVTLGEITKNISIKNADKKVEQVVSVTKHRGIVNSLDFFKKQVFSKELSTYKVIKRGQFAYATIHLDEGSIGFLADHDVAVLSPMYTVFEAKKTKVDIGFLFTVLKSDRLLSIYDHVGVGSINRRKSIPYSVFAKIEIPLPPLPEQQKIAEILSAVDEKIAVINEQLTQTQELKKGLMQRLLTRGIGHTVFKNSLLGEIPDSWEGLCFNDLVKFSGGAQPPRSTFVFEPEEGYIRLVQTRDYRTDKYKTYIPSSLARKKCTKDDIMIGRYGPPIFQILRGIEGAYNVALIKAIPNESKLLREYLFYYISQHKIWAFVENLSQRGGGQTGVDLDELKKYPFPLPPFAEQGKIIEILTTVDDKLQVLTNKKSQYQELKRGLMQQLLTGQRRVRIEAELATVA